MGKAATRGIAINPLVQREGADPTTADDLGYWYPKDVAGVTEAFFDNHTHAPVQLTSQGAINVPATAPPDAQYLVLVANGTLTQERVFTPGTSLSIVDGGAGAVYSVNTIQDIRTTASPTFVGATLSGLTANGFLYPGAGGALTSTAAATDGQLLIGRTGLAPVAATLTDGVGITISEGAGTITTAIDQAFTPTWTGLHTFNLSGGPGNSILLDVTAGATVDSNTIIWRGRSNDGSAHTVDFVTQTDVTSTAGAGRFTIQYVLDAALSTLFSFRSTGGIESRPGIGGTTFLWDATANILYLAFSGPAIINGPVETQISADGGRGYSIKNTSASANASAMFNASNDGSVRAIMSATSTVFTTTGTAAANMASLYAVSGGWSMQTDSAQPIVFGVNLDEVGRWTATGGNFIIQGGTSATAAGGSAVGVLALGNGTAPTTGTDITQLWAADYAAGDSRLYLRSESGDHIALGNDSLTFHVNAANEGKVTTAALTGDRVYTFPDSTLTVAGQNIDNAFSAVQTFTVDRGVLTTNQTSSAGASAGTLGNAPAAGDPGFWLKIKINNTNYAVPAWLG